MPFGGFPLKLGSQTILLFSPYKPLRGLQPQNYQALNLEF